MFRQNTYRKGILWLLFFNGIARGITFLLGILLARNFLPEETDVYLFVWSLITIICVIISQINLMVAGPSYIVLTESKKDKEAANICSAFFNIYLVLLFIFTVLVIVAPVVTYDVISGFNAEQLKPFEPVLRFSGIWLSLAVLNTFISNIFLSRKYFVVYIIGQVVTSLITLFLIVVLKKQFGIESFFIGQLAGNIICFVFYLVLLKVKLNQRIRLFYFAIPRKVSKELAAVLIVSVPTVITNFLIVYFLSNFSTGQLSAYNYGSMLANLPDAVFVSQFISVFGVKLAEEAAKNERHNLFNTFRFFGNHLFFFMTGIAIVFSLSGYWIIEILYGKENFGKELFETTVFSLCLLSAALPFKALDVLNNRLFASLQSLSSLVKYSLPVKLFNIALLIFMASTFGFEGLLWQQVCMPAVMVIVQMYALGRFFPVRKIKKYFLQVFGLLLIGLAVYVGARYFVNDFLIDKNPYLMILIIMALVLLIGYIIEIIFKLTVFNKLIAARSRMVIQKIFGSRPVRNNIG